ncbi:hypothetical protein PPERSA_12960 [Pseudocohnilembus persalinus]|uniref:Tricarboxylate/iron carrier n=1 Tax=Pseudocohnilembus persalinus TaxID=266149 RepID=A0A0V0R1T3_PSEPJ|nr:hypothetical protein PPERSA_12960 [Pseudocohnilembus persalinus]|eukprot:KRX08479.1 hypothetical protein PPERSA_12960 [Pseudocohnilembus persalinus]
MQKYDPSLEAPYDLTTYFGRLKHFQNISNQRRYFYSDDYLMEQRQILKDFESGKKTDYTDKQLWEARYFYLGNFHPQTDTLIHKLFRTSGYCIVNAPVIFCLTFLPPTPVNQIIAQTLNQTFNFAYNFTNGNKSNKYEYSQLAFSYSMAVASAIIGSLGSLALINRLKVSPSAKNIMKKFAPYIGVAVANEANLFFSRIKDFQQGIKVYDAETKEEIEQNSIEAAKIGFFQTGVSRCVIPIPLFLVPALWLSFSTKYKLQPKNIILATALNTAIGSFSLYLGLTYALAIYPQNVIVKANQLEPYFQNLTNKNGKQIEYFTFNKVNFIFLKVLIIQFQNFFISNMFQLQKMIHIQNSKKQFLLTII